MNSAAASPPPPHASGPTREGHFTIEHRGIERVPDDARYGRPFRVFTVWFAPQITPIGFFVGTLAASSAIGLGWRAGLLAILLGDAIGAIPLAALTLMGPRTGMAQIPLSRMPFGKSIVVPGMVNWASTIGWEAFINIFGAAALSLLTGLAFWICVLLILAGQLVLGVLGYEAIQVFEKWMTLVLGLVFLVLTVKIASIGVANDRPALHGASFVGGFILMTTIVVGVLMGWVTYAADYTRYLSANVSRRAVFWLAYAGAGLGLVWIEVLGLAAAGALSNKPPMTALRDLLGGGALGGVAMLAAYLSTISANALNDYTGGLSLQASGIRIRRPVSAVLGAILAVALTFYLHAGGTASKAENLLLFITYWAAPWLAIVTIDWLWRRGRLDLARIGDFRRLGSGWTALVALGVGFAASLPFSNTSLGVELVASTPPLAPSSAGSRPTSCMARTSPTTSASPLAGWSTGRCS